MLRMLKSYFGTGKYIILDSGFCVLKALIDLKRHGLFACALIKKRCFWPTGVPGIAMDNHMAGSEVGSVDAIQGSMEGVLYNLCAMKEPDYVVKMMATGGSLLWMIHAAQQVIAGLKEVFRQQTSPLTLFHLTSISSIVMQWMIITTYNILYLLGRMLG